MILDADKMTFEELKTEAERQGYKLVKKPIPLPKIHPCTCGRKKMETWYQAGSYKDLGTFLRCPRCGKKGGIGKTYRETREKWNALFEVKT